MDGGAGERRPRQAGEVGVAVGRDLRAGLHEPEHRRDDDGIAGPGHRRPRPAAPGEQRRGRDRRHGEEGEDVAGRGRVEPALEQVGRVEPPRHQRLPEVEAESVRGLRRALDRPVLRECPHRRHLRLREEGQRRRAEREHRVGRLLEQPGRPPERIHVEQEEDDRQRHAPGLREEREDEARERHEVPSARPAGPLGRRHAHVGQHRGEVEEAGEHVAPLRRPRHRLDTQRMDGEEERARYRGPGARRGRALERAREQRAHEVVAEHGVRRVQQEARQVVTGRVEAPEGVVEPERHPAERLVVPAEDGREHPAQVGPREPAVARVVREVEVVVPEDEVIRQHRDEADDHHGDHERGYRPSRQGSLPAQVHRPAPATSISGASSAGGP